MIKNVRAYTAIAMLASGVGLNIAGFIAPPFGEISDSVLCCDFVASLLTLGIAHASMALLSLNRSLVSHNA